MNFIAIGDAKRGDILLNYDGTEEEIKSIEFVNDDSTVYNIEVKGNHNYFAENILVHNKCGKYAGSDVEVQAGIDADKVAWEASRKSIQQLNERATSLLEANALQAEQASKAAELKREEVSMQQASATSQAGFQAGQAGLVTGEATRNIGRVKEAGGVQRKGMEQTFEMEETGRETKLEESLFGIAQSQSSLYANFLAGRKETRYGGTPSFEQAYSGGTTWTPTTSGDISSWAGSAGNLGIGGSCFTSDTKVDNKNISEIEVGDFVASYNTETKIIEKAEVIETFKHKHNNGYLIVNGRIKATPNHPFYIKRST